MRVPFLGWFFLGTPKENPPFEGVPYQKKGPDSLRRLEAPLLHVAEDGLLSGAGWLVFWRSPLNGAVGSPLQKRDVF